MSAADGAPVELANTLIEVAFVVRDSRVEQLSTRVWAWPELKLWSESSTESGKVRVLHHGACSEFTVSRPPDGLNDLLLDYGGPVRPWSQLGFSKQPDGRFTTLLGSTLYEVAEDERGVSTYRAWTKDRGVLIFTQERLILRRVDHGSVPFHGPAGVCWSTKIDAHGRDRV